MAEVLYLAELVAFDPSTRTASTLRYASGRGYVTTPSETPASTHYDARIKQAVNIRRSLFSDGKLSGRSRVGYGDLVLYNGDGALDALLGYAVEGRAVTVRRGTPESAYPGGFTTIFSGTMEQVEVRGDTLVVKLRDKQMDLLQPLQPVKYAGSNALPDGLEGVAGDLKGKPKPICLGQVYNAPIPCVNTAKLIYQVADTEIETVDAVYDSGVPLLQGFPLTSRSHGFGSNSIFGLAYGAGLFVAVGRSGTLQTSPDTLTWTTRTSGFGSSAILQVAYANGLFVAVGESGTLATSTDGITWTTRTSGFGSTLIKGVAYGAGVWVIVGFAGKLATSPDGITWTLGTSGFGTTNIACVAYGNGRFVIGGSAPFAGAPSYVGTSLDGTTWTVGSTGSTLTDLFCLSYGGGLFIAGGQASFVITSPDGVTWTERDHGISFDSSGVVYAVAYGTAPDGSALYAAVGTYGTASTSPDGITWTQVTSGSSASIALFAALLADGRVVAAGSSGTLASSGAGPTYPTLAALVDDTQAPDPGSFRPYYGPEGTYVRLGASPYGQITADATEGAATANRTAAQLFVKVLQRAGKVTGDWSASDVTALDTAASGACGYWTMDEVDFADALDEIAASPLAWWGANVAGVYRIQQLSAPAGTAALQITANDLAKPLARLAVSDATRGLPSWRTILRYQRNYAVQVGAGGGSTGTGGSGNLAGGGQDLETNTAVIASGSTVPRTLAERFGEVFNVLDYGAAGDGATDDAAAFTSAITAATAAGGGVVDVPAGVYLLRSAVALADNVTLLGRGNDTVLQSESDTTDGHSLVTMTDVEHAHVRHLKLDGKASARVLLSAASGASIAGSRYCSIENVTVVDCGRTAANFEGVALGITGLEADADSSFGNRIVHCRIEDPGGRLSFGIRLYTDWTVNQADSAYVNEVRDNLIGWNVIVGVGFNGIEIAGPATRYNLIEGNQVRDHLGVSGIEADKGAQYNRYVGNSVVNMEATASAGEAAAFRDQGFPSGAHPERFATGNVWVGNTADTIFRDDGTEDSLYGFLFSRSKQCTVLGHRVRDVSSVGFASTTGGSRAFGCNATVERLRLNGARCDGVNVGLALSAATTITGLTVAESTLRVGLYGTLNASANVFTQIAYCGNVIEAISAGTTGIDLGAESSVLVEGNTLVGFTLGVATGTATVRFGFNTFLSCTTAMSGSGVVTARTLPGAMGLAAAARTDTALDVELGGITTGATQYGVLVDTIPDSTNTTRHIGIYARARSAAAAYTVPTASDLYAANPGAGAGSTITTAIGLEIENITAGGTNNYAIRTGTGRHSFGDDIEATGGFRQTIDGWYQDNVVASQTNVELTRAAGRFRAVRAGSVTGVIVTSTEARTAGTLTVTVYKNTGLAGAAGGSIGLTAVLDGTNTSRKATTQAKDTDTFAAGDELYVVVTTDGSWLPVTADIRVAVEIED